MNGRIVRWSARVPGGLEGLGDAFVNGVSRGLELDDPKRPASIPFGRWRRMSRLSRLATLVVGEVLADGAVAGLPVVLGTAMGEVVPSSLFLDRILLEGDEKGSPLAFQNSVYNATAAHLAMAFDLRGPSESISAGLASGVASLARGLELLVRHEQVLVVLADDRNPTTLRAYGDLPCGEAVVAVLVERGSGVRVRDGVHAPVFARGVRLPYEQRFVVHEAKRPEAVFGLHPASGLLAFLTTGTAVVDQDDGMALTVSRT